MTSATFSLYFGPGRKPDMERVGVAAAALGNVTTSGPDALGVRHDRGRARLTVVKTGDEYTLDATCTAESTDVTRDAWPLELASHLFVALGGRLGVLGPEEIDRVTDEARASRLDVWWSEGCLLVDEPAGSLAHSFEIGWGEQARWTTRRLEGGNLVLYLPGWFGMEGERDDHRFFSPFHLFSPGFDRNENRYDQLTVTVFGASWKEAAAAAACKRLVEVGEPLEIRLHPAPLGFPEEALAAGWLNHARSHLVDQFPRAAAWSQEDREFVRTLLSLPLAVPIHFDTFVRLSILFVGAVHLTSTAGPLVLFWTDQPGRVCLGFPLGEEIYEGYVLTPEQVRVAETFIEALGLEWGAASVGNNGTLTSRSREDADLMRSFPWVSP